MKDDLEPTIEELVEGLDGYIDPNNDMTTVDL